MQAKLKDKNSRSLSKNEQSSKDASSEAIRQRARNILRTMPKELKALCDQLSKY